MTITEFLLARIAEDEALATSVIAGGPSKWVAIDPKVVIDREERGPLTWAKGVRLGSEEDVDTLRSWGIRPLFELTTYAGAHIARHDPDRVLAECAAKRRIVGLLPPNGGMFDLDGEIQEDPSPILLALASVYADHEDYDDAWRLTD